MSPQNKFGKKFKDARERLDLTQAQVAQKAKISETYYAMVEREDDGVNPSFEKLESIAKVLNLKLSIS